MFYRFLIIVLGVCFCLIGTIDGASARREKEEKTSYKPVYMPELYATSVVVDNDDEPPREPFLSEVDFLKYPELRSIEERVSRLLHGISVDIQPEYDHYGHEIRRYMAHVGNDEIYKDREYLKKQINNVKVSFIIAEYWERYIEEEIKVIRDILDADQNEDNVISFQARTAFRQNKIKARTFVISLKTWITANEEKLMEVYTHFTDYKIMYPEVMITMAEDRIDFFNAITASQTKLKEIKKYLPFSIMVY